MGFASSEATRNVAAGFVDPDGGDPLRRFYILHLVLDGHDGGGYCSAQVISAFGTGTVGHLTAVPRRIWIFSRQLWTFCIREAAACVKASDPATRVAVGYCHILACVYLPFELLLRIYTGVCRVRA